MPRPAKIILGVLGLLVVAVIISNWTWARLPAEPPPPPGSHFADVDGARIHYVESRGSGPGVLMLHGHSGTALDWRRVQADLPGLRTIAIDRPGYGYSKGGYVPFDRQVGLLHDLARKLGLKRPIVAGHSYGGALALAYAERYPKQTAAVVAVDPAIDPNPPGTADRAMARVSDILGLPIVHTIGHLTFTQLLRTIIADAITPAGFAPQPVDPRYMRNFRAVSLKREDLQTSAAETLGRANVSREVDSGLGQIVAPTWVLAGRLDKVVPPAVMRGAARQIRGSRFEWLPGGHMQTWTHPAAVAAAIRSAEHRRS